MSGVQLGLLKPLWHLYLKLMSKYGQSDTLMKPPLLLALTELFLAAEIAAEVRRLITVLPFLLLIHAVSDFAAYLIYSSEL